MPQVSFEISPEDRVLAQRLAADDFNFWHDINGIQRNLDRQTGRLQNRFLPRCHVQAVRTSTFT